MDRNRTAPGVRLYPIATAVRLEKSLRAAITTYMVAQDLHRLATTLRAHRNEVLSEWRNEVRKLPGAQNLEAPVINDEVPMLLDKLFEQLDQGSETVDLEAISASAEHGLLRWQSGFDVIEVVTEYNILRRCLHEFAERSGFVLSGTAGRIVNLVFEEAVGRAVKAFETMMTIELRQHHQEHIAFIVHDLRTPLEAMSLATTLLDRSIRGEARNGSVESALSVLRSNIDRLDERVRFSLQGTKGIHRTLDTQFSSLNLRECVEEMIRDLKPIAELFHTTIVNDVAATIEVYSDSRLLSQLIQNLLSNALKFTPEGVITFGAREEDDRSITCWVQDTGRGIDPDVIDKVFDRFETAGSESHRGIGLGLAIVKEIVELHKGTINVSSELGQGSTFSFKIPGPPIH